MSKTTMRKTSWFGDFSYVADDDNGHEGHAYSPEKAQEALEQAQRDDAPSAEHKVITGSIISNKE